MRPLVRLVSTMSAVALVVAAAGCTKKDNGGDAAKTLTAGQVKNYAGRSQIIIRLIHAG